jgi:S1-C subfamily serine protease
VLQLSGATGLTPAPIGDSVTVGTPVLAIGNRAGRGGAPATAPGVINGLNWTIRAADGISGFTETLHGMLQTSARIQPGDSGGPLAGPTGTVIGVDTAAGTGTSPTGYAIPIGTAMALERQIAAGHRAPGISIGTAAFLGVVVTSPPSATPVPRPRAPQARDLSAASAAPRPAACLGTRSGAEAPAAVAPAGSGAVVDGVLCGTGASEVGIAAGDVITRVAGRPVSSASALSAAMSGCRPGAVVPVTWTTVAGVTRTSLVRLGAAPAP